MMLVEMPRLENVFQVSQLKMIVSVGTNYVKVALKAVSQVIQALFIFYVYIIFRDAVNMIENYRTDVDFNNNFVTRITWSASNPLHFQRRNEQLEADECRKVASLLLGAQIPLKWKGNTGFLSLPNRAELDRAKVALMSWFVTTFAAALLILLDYYLYSFLDAVIFSFVVRRVIINYFMPFMFPLRDRVRIIHLYNKVLFLRMKHRVEARARIRFIVERWRINEEHDEGGWLSYQSWFKRNILDRLFRTGQCLMCQMATSQENSSLFQQIMKPAYLYFCVECPATYCRYCLAETGWECYACQAEEGLVNTEKSMVTYADKSSDKFVPGGKRRNNLMEKGILIAR
ncbi:DC-STAMP-like protein [Cooperia oncophora]